MPDNGFGTKANSADFLLRHLPGPSPLGSRLGRPAAIQILRYITLSDPNHKINFPIVRRSRPRSGC